MACGGKDWKDFFQSCFDTRFEDVRIRKLNACGHWNYVARKQICPVNGTAAPPPRVALSK
jgi:hypothetical protein